MLTRLLVLWLLAEGPSHPYAIVRALGDEGFAFWCPVERGSVYAVLRTLVREGWVRRDRSERDGRRPRRTVYAITPEGRRRYRGLLRRAWSEPPLLADPMNAALAARADLGEEVVAASADARVRALERRIADAERLRRAAPDPAIADRSIVLARAEIGWIRGAFRGGATP